MDLAILFGGPRREPAVARLREAGHPIVTVVVPRSRPSALEASVQRMRSDGFNVVECGRNELEEVLAPLSRATLISIGFPYLIPNSILSTFTLCLNVHPTLLPMYRGPMSGAHIIINGEQRTGVTVHLMDAGMDTGAIVTQREIKLSKFDTVRSMQRKVYAIEGDVLVKALALIQDPDFRPQPQDDSRATSYPCKRAPADSEIDPGRPLLELFDQIRACDPDAYPAFFLVEGQKVCVRFWRPDKPAAEADAGMI